MPGCSVMSGGGGQDQISYNASQSSPSFVRLAIGGRKRHGTKGRGGMMYGGDGLTSLASNSVGGRRRTRRTKGQKKRKTARRGVSKRR